MLIYWYKIGLKVWLKQEKKKKIGPYLIILIVSTRWLPSYLRFEMFVTRGSMATIPNIQGVCVNFRKRIQDDQMLE